SRICGYTRVRVLGKAYGLRRGRVPCVHLRHKDKGRREESARVRGRTRVRFEGGDIVNTCVKIAGVTFKNPVITASGTFGFGKEYAEFYPLSALGGICTKGLTIEERQGNPSPRV